jgi:hypothetical protein
MFRFDLKGASGPPSCGRPSDSDVTFTPISMTPVGFESMIATYFRLQTDVTLSTAVVISRRPEMTGECKAVPGNYVIWNSQTGVSCSECPLYHVSEHGRCHEMSRRMQAFCVVKLPYWATVSGRVCGEKGHHMCEVGWGGVLYKEQWYFLTVMFWDEESQKSAGGKEPICTT